MSTQVLSPFEEQLTLALASNPEFIKQTVADYNQKVTGYCVALQIKQTIKSLSNGE